MNESLLRDENLTTADIANPVRANMVPPADINEQNIQPIQENRQAQWARKENPGQTYNTRDNDTRATTLGQRHSGQDRPTENSRTESSVSRR